MPCQEYSYDTEQIKAEVMQLQGTFAEMHGKPQYNPRIKRILKKQKQKTLLTDAN